VNTGPFTARDSSDQTSRQEGPTSAQTENGSIAPDGAFAPEFALVADIWKKILGIEEIGMVDDFFVLGGNSLQVMLLGSRILRATGVELPLAAFFDEPTFGSLWETVSAGLAARKTVTPAP
jgi:acyl carrier protein